MKRTATWKIDVWRTSFVCNLVSAIAFQPFLFLLDAPPTWHLWWQPVIVGVLYVAGQVLTLTSLAQGEISVAAPVLGLKILFVPIFLWLVGAGLLPTSTWLACSGATLAVVLLNTSDGSVGRGRVVFSIATASLGAAAFAMFDVCVQMWSSNWGQGAFLPIMFLVSSLISLTFILRFEAPLRTIPRAAWPSLWGAALFIAVQALCIVCSVAFWQQVAVSNVVYSSRGLWSLVFIWLLGRYLRVTDTGLTPRVFALRMCGAIVLLASIGLMVS
ncbi:MAG: hypothetical protein R3C53_25355 [Pirellulaceae bacterium]